ncbi:MAG: glycosyltransferase family 4 protein [Desulfatitalea sp.]|nr:glycosyltransferase family 4 protein [Desulfatitalea sp.]NNJ99971.1 glycosyltransferase family 4 protein [Desulfatitalea sp.]
MNILFATIAWPENGERNIYTDLMDEFAAAKHHVFILGVRERRCGKPTECLQENGLQVLRVRCGNLQKTSILEKGASLLRLNTQLRMALAQYFTAIRFDLIIYSTPPVTLSPLMKKLKTRHQAKIYLLLKDLWPQGPVDLGALRKGGLVWRYFRRQEKIMFQDADFIGCMSPAGVRYVLAHNPGLDAAKVEVCPNAIRPSVLQPSGRNRIREKYGIPLDAVVFLFGGNLGKPQGLSFLIGAIEALGQHPGVYFLIIGAGTHFPLLQDAFERLKPANAALYSRLPKQDYDLLAGACDVGLILLDKRYTIPHFPSRLLSYLDVGIPVLLAVNRATDIGDVVERAGCGCVVEHGDLQGFVSAVRYLAENTGQRQEMGWAARKLLEDQYTARLAYDTINRRVAPPGSHDSN